MNKAILVFQTDFTYKEGAVSSMYGVVKSVDRDLEIFDSTHEIPNYDIYSASFRLFQPLKFWPKGTVFVSVVDPGVGTFRKASIAYTENGYYIVTPDNGTLTHVDKIYGIKKIVEIDTNKHRLTGFGTETISVFHGRDIFAYCGAKLASGQVKFEEFGQEYDVKDIVRFDIIEPEIKGNLIIGTAEIIDPNFGNLWTNIPISNLSDVLEKKVLVKIYDENHKVVFEEYIKVHKTFGDVLKGEITIYQNEYGNIAIAINQGSFIKKYQVPYGANIKIEILK